jgi:hypothetical protein
MNKGVNPFEFYQEMLGMGVKALLLLSLIGTESKSKALTPTKSCSGEHLFFIYSNIFLIPSCQGRQ